MLQNNVCLFKADGTSSGQGFIIVVFVYVMMFFVMITEYELECMVDVLDPDRIGIHLYCIYLHVDNIPVKELSHLTNHISFIIFLSICLHIEPLIHRLQSFSDCDYYFICWYIYESHWSIIACTPWG